MKKLMTITIMAIIPFMLFSSLMIEAGTGVSNNVNEKPYRLFGDMTIYIDDFSFYVNYKDKGKLNGYVEYYNRNGIINHQCDIFTQYIFTEGGYSALSYMMMVNLSWKRSYFTLGAGAEGAVLYSEYTETPLFILSPQFRLRLGYKGESANLAIFLENNYRFEKDWNAKTSYGFECDYFLSPRDILSLSLSFTSCEVLMDNFRVLYAMRMRMGYRRAL